MELTLQILKMMLLPGRKSLSDIWFTIYERFNPSEYMFTISLQQTEYVEREIRKLKML